MPTVYTRPIYDGENITFEDFLLLCEREFDLMCVGIFGSPIPDKAPVDNFFREGYEMACRRYYLFARDKEAWRADRERKYNDYLKDIEESYKKEVDDITELKARYQKILDDVENWVPPTKEHEQLKDFAIKQLKKSIDSDCFVPRPFSPSSLEEYTDIALQERGLLESCSYWKDEYERYEEARKKRDEWVRQLKESLGR